MGAVDTTYTFTATDTITSSKMNNIIDQTTITGDAIFGTTLEVVSGKLKVRSQGITSSELASNAVTSTQIASGSIDPSKLTAGYPSWTSSGNLTINGATTALSSITANTASVSIGSARTASGASNIDFNSTFPLTSYEARISRESGADGNLVISNTGNGTIKFNNKDFQYLDSASLLFIYDEIFNKQIYNFKTDRKSPVIIDAGANIGLSVIYFKLKFPEAQITAFEPDEEVFSVLKNNMASFGFKGLSLIKKGLWKEETTLTFNSEGADAGRISENDNEGTKEIANSSKKSDSD